MTQHPGTPQSSAQEWQPTNPPAPPPPEKEKSWFARHKVLTTILALVAFFVVASTLSGGDESGQSAAPAQSTSVGTADDAAQNASAQEGTAEETVTQDTTEPAAAEPAAPESPGIGDAVRDGKFEFVVTGVEDGGTEVGNEFLSEKAQGRFQLIHITVTNIGDEPQMMSDSNQRVKDEQGRSFEVDSMAGIHLDDNDIWLEDINPGNTVTGTLVFDMPEGSTPVEIELHDSMFSGGVTVALT